MNKLFTAILLISLMLSCSKSKLEQAQEIYKRSPLQNKVQTTPSGLQDAIALLNEHLKKQPDNLGAKILLWKCYVRTGNAKSDALKSEILSQKQTVVSCIQPYLHDDDEIVRQQLATLLGELNTPAVVPILLEILEKDQYKNVQQAASEALAGLHDHRAVPILLKKLDSSEPLVRYYAVAALGHFNDEILIQRLLDILANPRETSDVRHQAALSLVSIHNPISEAGLVEIFTAGDQPEDTKLLAAMVLGAFGNPAGLNFALDQAKSDNGYLVGLALTALGFIHDANALPVLIDNLKYGNKALRSLAAEALGRLGDPKAIPSLQQALTDPISSVRESAQAALALLEK
ncbi:MAG: HEAT repeat domain-containing protein [Candidatus Zhuqueibacterota bacterium]